MADISQTQTPAQTGAGKAAPLEEGPLETELERAEKRLKDARDQGFMAEHEEGVGPTLGEDLLRPNPGHAANWNAEDDDPPT